MQICCPSSRRRAVSSYSLSACCSLSIVILVGATYWVYNDARERDDDRAVIWALLTALGFFIGLIPGVLVLVVYLLVREGDAE